MNKLILTIFTLFLIFQISESANLKKSVERYYGTANNWVNYTSNTKGIYIDVQFPELGLIKKPYVNTHLTCSSHCWTTAGTTSIYLLTKNSFRVYIYTVIEPTLTVAQASARNYVLNYEIISMDQ